MKPVTPIPGLPFTVYAKDQPEYIPLPAFREPGGTITTRWRATWWERLRIFFTGNIWLQVLTFNRPLQPLRLSADCPLSEVLQTMGKQALKEDRDYGEQVPGLDPNNRYPVFKSEPSSASINWIGDVTGASNASPIIRQQSPGEIRAVEAIKNSAAEQAAGAENSFKAIQEAYDQTQRGTIG